MAFIREDLDTFYDAARLAGQILAWRAPAPRAPARRLRPAGSCVGVTRRPILPCYNRLVFPAKIQGIIMPKLKTHKGASKRFKKTGTGLVVRNHAFGRHILTSKPHKRKKKLHQSVVADKADQPVLKRMIPY